MIYMKVIAKILFLLLIQMNPTRSETILKVKGSNFIFEKELGVFDLDKERESFYDDNGRILLITKIKKCNKKKCVAKILKRRKGLKILKGMTIYSKRIKKKELYDEPISSPDEKPENEKKKGIKTNKKYLVKAGLGGQNSASLFAEIDFVSASHWSYGFVVSSRIVERKDLGASSFGYGGRVDYLFTPLEENGFLSSINLGLANITYKSIAIEGISDYSAAETTFYTSLTSGYRFWLSRALITLGAGLSYIGYTKQLKDPGTEIEFENPYPNLDLAVEASLGFSF